MNFAAIMAALAMLESGNNPSAIGTRGERTAWQMMPHVIRQYPDLAKDPANEILGRKYAQEELLHRIWHFEAEHNRVPTIREVGLLWHCPAHVLHPSAAESDYAERFENLVTACLSDAKTRNTRTDSSASAHRR